MSAPTAPPALALEAITSRIFVLRGQKVLLDSDLAALYGVETRRLNEQVRRNRDRFPEDFIFELTREEFDHLMSQFATSSLADGDTSAGHGGRRKLPMAFTEHGAIQAATVLSSPRAVQVSVYVVRAFVRLREALAVHTDLAKRLAELEMKTESLDMRHDTFSRNTRIQLKQVFEALRALTTPPEPSSAPKRPIGFITPQDTKTPKASKIVKEKKSS